MIDYKAGEDKEIKKFIQKFCEGKIQYGDRYPPPDRLKLDKLYTKSIVGKDFWTQIPMYGTTIIILKPVKKDIFEKVHGFDVVDIDRIMDFAKETGRVQFALDFDEDPLCYRKLDFLEPVFMDADLKPPQLLHLPLDAILSEEEIEKTHNEYRHLLKNPQAQSFIKGYIKGKYYENTYTPESVIRAIVDDLIKLKLSGHEDLVKDFTQGLTTIGTTRIVFLLQAIHDMFFYAYDPLMGVRSFKRGDLRVLYERFPFGPIFSKEKELPYEVGKFLNDKLKIVVPKNIDGAIELSDEYELYDLRNVMNALNEGVEKEKIDVINENLDDLSIIFDNAWKEANKLKRDVNIYTHGISLGIGVIGTLATMPIVGVSGLLAGLGLTVGGEIATPKISEPLAEKITKWTTSSHLIHVYDFKKKYKLTK